MCSESTSLVPSSLSTLVCRSPLVRSDFTDSKWTRAILGIPSAISSYTYSSSSNSEQASSRLVPTIFITGVISMPSLVCQRSARTAAESSPSSRSRFRYKPLGMSSSGAVVSPLPSPSSIPILVICSNLGFAITAAFHTFEPVAAPASIPIHRSFETQGFFTSTYRSNCVPFYYISGGAQFILFL